MRVLFATAEFEPLAMVGGLGAASAGLVHGLRALGVEVRVVMPDYGGVTLAGELVTTLDVPAWARPASARRGTHPVAGDVTLVSVPGMARAHPYLEPSGEGFADNDARFFAFSQAVASLAAMDTPDLIHLNDWHTATALAALDRPPPSVLSIHNLAYQGITSPKWIPRLGPRRAAYARAGDTNPLAGAIALADRVVVVSPNYAREVRTPQGGAGLHDLLLQKGARLTGILNGIDTAAWDPRTDRHLVARFGPRTLWRKRANTAALREELGLRPRADVPLFVVLSRLAEQKGIDLAVPLLGFLPTMPAQLAVLGAGEAATAAALRDAVARSRGEVAFVEGYDEALAHRLLAGGDLLLMPSRFEPCGLTQLQAMRYGTLPVATDVGGLHDTVTDLDHDPALGTGFLAPRAEPAAILDAMHRAVRGWGRTSARRSAQRRGMTRDWSWRAPAAATLAVYESAIQASRGGGERQP